MKKLSKEEKANLLSMLAKLDKLEGSGSKDLDIVKEGLNDVMNDFSSVVNKNINDVDKSLSEVKIEPFRGMPSNHVAEAKNSFNETLEEFEQEENILNEESYLDMIIDLTKLNQQIIDKSIIIMENAPDEHAKGLKKNIDRSLENKRVLKNVYKSYIDNL